MEVPSKKPSHGWWLPLSAFKAASGIEFPLPSWCEMSMKSLLSRKVQLAFACAFLILVVVGAIS